MRQAFQAALLVVATLLAYHAYQRYNYSPGRHSYAALDRALELADEVNARDDPKVKAVLEEAERTGKLDTRKLEAALLQKVFNAADIARIRRQINDVSRYAPPPDHPPARTDRRPPAPAPQTRDEPQQRAQQPIRLPGVVTVPATPQGQPMTQRPAVVDDERTLPTAEQLTSEDAIERRQAEVVLKKIIWRQHQNAFGLGSGSFGKMRYAEFAEAFIKREYGDKAALIKVPE
jgi:hypothetical protein